MPDGLRVHEVTRRFGGLVALNAVSAQAPRGRITGLVGTNGSGKTTLLNCISGVLTPDEGEITWQGQRISRLRLEKTSRTGVIRTFQDARLLPDESIETTLRIAADVQQTRHTLREVGALFVSQRRWRRERDTLVTEVLERYDLAAVRHLSVADAGVGVANIVALASAELRPKWRRADALLLLDEPFAGVDTERASGLLVNILREWRAAGATIVVVDHRMDIVARLCEQLVVLREGSLIAAGETEEVLRRDIVRSALLGVEEG